MQKRLGLFTDILYQAGTVNHATKNKIAKTTVAPCWAGMVNHAMTNETAKIRVAPYQVNNVNHAMMNTIMKITDTIVI